MNGTQIGVRTRKNGANQVSDSVSATQTESARGPTRTARGTDRHNLFLRSLDYFEPYDLKLTLISERYEALERLFKGPPLGNCLGILYTSEEDEFWEGSYNRGLDLKISASSSLFFLSLFFLLHV